MEKKIQKLIQRYNDNKINLSELYIKLKHLQRECKYSIEDILHKHADASTLFLLLTYQFSQPLK